MITIEIKQPYKKSIVKASVKKIASTILFLVLQDSESDLSILITSDSTLQRLNKEYLGYDQPTDVLSFESKEIDPETGKISLGDIAISYPAAERQAIEAGHSVENEILMLLVHGILHLSGFDHKSKDEKFEMWNKQQAILNQLGIKINRISGDEEFHD
jgi:probable rRNA maturation factor